ncbi:MAG: GntR family transcriptional regulator [Chthoniobacteraceae bacterium]|nr:GntR family transcriptional regulator [Chthoniobacteraceae bacterium]
MAKPVFFPSYKRIADSLRERILHGNYVIKPIPSERQLAEEFGVNYMTVRRGLQLLERDQLIVRQPNGRMQVKRIQQGAKKHLNFALLLPTLASQALEVWRTAIAQATEGLLCSVRPMLYMNWDDTVLIDAVDGFDGVFLSPFPTPPPDAIAARLRQPEHPVVVIDNDFSKYGIPSIRMFPPVYVQQLLNHLESLGHTKIGCFNTQPGDSEIHERIDQWRFWMGIHGFSGRLIDSAVPPHVSPILHAYELMNEVLSNPHREETAWFFITTPAALGAMRAILDHGLLPGRDLAICAANGEGLAPMLNPPLTALEAGDPTPFISYCLNWMSKPDQKWLGPLLMQPPEVPLIIRESTKVGAGVGIGASAC